MVLDKLNRQPSVRWTSQSSTAQAIQEPLPMSRLRPPKLLQLTNATLPTSSLSHFSAMPTPPPPAHTRRSSSIESLQSAYSYHRTSSNGTIPTVESPIATSTWSWWQPRSKKRGSGGPSIDSLRSLTMGKPAPTTSSVASSSTSIFDNSPWSWWQSQTKSQVDTLLDDSDKADSISEEREHIRRKYKSPKNPVVFCHGLLGFDSVTIGPSIAPLQVTHWRGIKEVLEANGTEVLITRVPATSSPVDRAKMLESQITKAFPGRCVHLIGHSMGGIDCRYLTTHLQSPHFSVLSVTTLAAPHRGSIFADHFLATLGKERLPSFLSFLDLLPNGGGDGKAFEFLTVDSMARFNEETPDVPSVKYFSWGAVYQPGLVDVWRWSHSVVLEKEGPNDGLVSVESSKWGKYCGTLQDVSHLDLVGWVNPARYKWAEMMGNEIKFKPATFYLGVGDMLAGEVEGQEDQSDQTESERPDESGESAGRKHIDTRLAEVAKR